MRVCVRMHVCVGKGVEKVREVGYVKEFFTISCNGKHCQV